MWSGGSIGTLLIFSLAGYLADTLGWESVFYVTGVLSLVWVVFWFLLVSETPQDHPRISKEEKKYIESSIGKSSRLDRRNIVTPWRDILTSIPVWAFIIGDTASNWGNYVLNQQLPTYLSNVLRFSLSFNGLMSSLCYFIQFLVCILGSWMTDYIRSKSILSTLTIRKINTILGIKRITFDIEIMPIINFQDCGFQEFVLYLPSWWVASQNWWSSCLPWRRASTRSRCQAARSGCATLPRTMRGLSSVCQTLFPIFQAS